MCSLLQCVFQSSVYAQSMWFCLYQRFPPVWPPRDMRRSEGTRAEGQMGAMLRVVCFFVFFVGCVRDVLRGRGHKDGGRLQISVTSSSAVRKCRLKVPWKVFLLRCLRMIGSMSI